MRKLPFLWLALVLAGWSCSESPQRPDGGTPGPDRGAADQRAAADLVPGADAPPPADRGPGADGAPDRAPAPDAPPPSDRGAPADRGPDLVPPSDLPLSPDSACSSSAKTWRLAAGGSDLDWARDVAVDSAGNSHITGYFKGRASFGSVTLSSAGGLDAFVAKVDASGKVLWAVAGSGSSTVEGTDIAVDSAGNVYITGFYSGKVSFGSVTLSTSNARDIFVAKANASGKFLWAQSTLGAALDITSAIAVDSAGQATIASFMTARVSKDGKSWVWTNHGGGTAFDVTVDAAGNTYVTGTFKGVASFGTSTFTAFGKGDVFVARLDTLGRYTRGTVAPGAGFGDTAIGYALAQDGTGGLYVTGSYAGSYRFGSTTLKSLGSAGASDLFVTRLDSAGRFLWAVSGGGTGADDGAAVAADGSGCVATGSFSGSAGLGGFSLHANGSKPDIWVARLGRAGGVHWATRAGGSDADSGQGLALDRAGNSQLVGAFSGTAAFGSNSLSSSGGFDAFLVRINACGKF
jgi:hypothetical protein